MSNNGFNRIQNEESFVSPTILNEYLSFPTDSAYRPISEYNSVITRNQALDDIDELTYLIENRYCGKDYWERHGVSFSEIYAKIRGFLKDQEQVYISDFCRMIHASFDCGIIDNHLGFASPLTGLLCFGRQYFAYFADALVEEVNNQNIVIESNSSTIPLGSVIDSADCLFPTLAPEGKKRFLIGKRSFQQLKEIAIIVNGKEINVSVHRCRASAKTEDYDICMDAQNRNGIPILRSNCCDYVGELTEHTDFIAMGKNYSDNNVLILNYLSNEGGYNRITREFIQGLNGYVHAPEYSMKLISPVTEGHDCKREWVTISTLTPYESNKGKFNGKLIMLVNSATASSGETAVMYARSVRDFILIGENTMGCNTFGNVRGYTLKNSGILCRVPNVINLCENPEECKEGYGFEPDYWVDSKNVEAEVIKWLSH